MDSKAKALDALMQQAAKQRQASGPINPKNAAKEAKKALSDARSDAEAKGKLAGFFPPKAISAAKRAPSEKRGQGPGGHAPGSQEARREREEAGEREPRAQNRPQNPLDMGSAAGDRAKAAGLDGFFPASATAGPKPRPEGGSGRGGSGRPGSQSGDKPGRFGRGQGQGGQAGRGAQGARGQGRGSRPQGEGDPYADSYSDAYGQEGSDRELEQYGHNRWKDPSELTREEREALEAADAPPKPPVSPEALPQLNAAKDLMSSFLQKHAGASSQAGAQGNAEPAAAPGSSAGPAGPGSRSGAGQAASAKKAAPSAPELDAGKSLMEQFLATQKAAEELSPEERVNAILSAAPRADENAVPTRGRRVRSDHHDDLLGEKTQWLRSGQSGAENGPAADGDSGEGASGADADAEEAAQTAARSARQTRKTEERARNKRNKQAMKEAAESGETLRTSQIERAGPAVKPPLAPKDALAAARKKGVDLLSRTDLAAQELIKRICRDERLAPYAAQAVEQLQALGLQSDERYAMGRARMRLYSRSANFVRRELADQGMPPELVESAIQKGLESHHVESDTDILAQSMARRFGPREPKFGSARDKQARWFVSRGYGFDQIKAVWAMARQGLLDQWASADFLDTPEEEDEEPSRSGRGSFGAKNANESGSGATPGDQKEKTRGHAARGSLDEAQLAELAQARERKFGEDAPKDHRLKAREIRWLSTRGATMGQIQEMWKDAADNAEVRLQSLPIAEPEPFAPIEAADPDLDSGSGWSRSSFGDPKGSSRGSKGEDDPDAFEKAWLKKYKGVAPANAKEKSRQIGWAARHGGSYSSVAALWERAENGEFE